MLRCATFTKFLLLKNQAETARKIIFPAVRNRHTLIEGNYLMKGVDFVRHSRMAHWNGHDASTPVGRRPDRAWWKQNRYEFPKQRRTRSAERPDGTATSAAADQWTAAVTKEQDTGGVTAMVVIFGRGPPGYNRPFKI
jgi:hypothetical protein